MSGLVALSERRSESVSRRSESIGSRRSESISSSSAGPPSPTELANFDSFGSEKPDNDEGPSGRIVRGSLSTTIERQGKLLYKAKQGRAYRLRFVLLDSNKLKVYLVDDNLAPIWTEQEIELEVEKTMLTVNPAKHKFVLTVNGSRDQHCFKAEGETSFDNWSTAICRIQADAPPPNPDDQPVPFKKKFLSKIRRGSKQQTVQSPDRSAEEEAIKEERRIRKQMEIAADAARRSVNRIVSASLRFDVAFLLSTAIVKDMRSIDSLMKCRTVSHKVVNEIEEVQQRIHQELAAIVFNLDSQVSRFGETRDDVSVRQDALKAAGDKIKQDLDELLRLADQPMEEPDHTPRSSADFDQLDSSNVSTEDIKPANTPPRPPRPVRPPNIPSMSSVSESPADSPELNRAYKASQPASTLASFRESDVGQEANAAPAPVTMWPMQYSEAIPNVDVVSYESRKRAMTMMPRLSSSKDDQFQAIIAAGLTTLTEAAAKRPPTPRVLAQQRRMSISVAKALLADEDDSNLVKPDIIAEESKQDSADAAVNSTPQINVDDASDTGGDLPSVARVRSCSTLSTASTTSIDDIGTMPRRPSMRKTSIIELGSSTTLKIRREEVEGRSIQRVISGKKAELIAHLLSDQNEDPDYKLIFLHCFEIFMTPEELLDQLLQHHENFMIQYKDGNNSVTEAEVLRAHQRACYVLGEVIEKCWENVDDDTLYQLDQLVYDLISTGRAEAAHHIREVSWTRRRAESASNQIEVEDDKDNSKNSPAKNQPLASLAISIDVVTIVNCSASALAKALTHLDYDLYSKINQNEIMQWRKKQSRDTSPNVYAVIDHFNKVSLWAASQILNQLEVAERIKAYQKLVETCKCLRKLRSFNMLMAVLAALNSSPVHRLKHTQDGSGTRSKNVLTRLQSLMSHEDSYATLRAALQTCGRPAIPYLGMYLTDITLVHLGNNDFLNPGEKSKDELIIDENSIVNFAKMRMLYNICKVIDLFQKDSYDGELDQSIAEFLGSFEYRTTDELFEISLHVEPRDAAIEDLS